MNKICLLLIAVPLLGSCSILKDGPKNELGNGVYHVLSDSAPLSKKEVYLKKDGDSLCLYALSYEDSSTAKPVCLAPAYNEERQEHYMLVQRTLDVDVLTIPLKFRPARLDFPPQLTTDFNGNIYFGSRYDFYSIDYHPTPIGGFTQDIGHFGFSTGGFVGIGTTAINPWVTNNSVMIEYSGIIGSIGVTGIIAVNDFTFGLGLGFDHLLDRNGEYWIYQGKPWLGITFGFNLN